NFAEDGNDGRCHQPYGPSGHCAGIFSDKGSERSCYVIRRNTSRADYCPSCPMAPIAESSARCIDGDCVYDSICHWGYIDCNFCRECPFRCPACLNGGNYVYSFSYHYVAPCGRYSNGNGIVNDRPVRCSVF